MLVGYIIDYDQIYVHNFFNLKKWFFHFLNDGIIGAQEPKMHSEAMVSILFITTAT
jgi:hypothetical protein